MDKTGKNPAVLGITGGVGAGKSTILAYLQEAYGAEIIECDRVGRELQGKGAPCYGPMVSLFGRQCLLEGGEIDRAYVARIIYEDAEKRRQLEEIVHPAVRNEVISRLKNTEAGLAVIESAILIEAGCRDVCDKIWYIHTSDEKRRERLKESRGYSDRKIDAIFRSQRSEASFREFADLTIDNTDDFVQNTYGQLDRGIREQFPQLVRKTGPHF